MRWLSWAQRVIGEEPELFLPWNTHLICGNGGCGEGCVCDGVLFCVFFFLFAKRSRLGRRPNEPKPVGKSVVHQLARRCHHPFSIRAHLFPRKACATPTPTPFLLGAAQHNVEEHSMGQRTQACARPRWRPKMGRFTPLLCRSVSKWGFVWKKSLETKDNVGLFLHLSIQVWPLQAQTA